MYSIISAIFDMATLESRGIPVPSRKSIPDCVELPATSETFDKVMRSAAELVGDYGKAEDALATPIIALIDAYENQGFINGLRYGIMLAKEWRSNRI